MSMIDGILAVVEPANQALNVVGAFAQNNGSMMSDGGNGFNDAINDGLNSITLSAVITVVGSALGAFFSYAAANERTNNENVKATVAVFGGLLGGVLGFNADKLDDAANYAIEQVKKVVVAEPVESNFRDNQTMLAENKTVKPIDSDVAVYTNFSPA